MPFELKDVPVAAGFAVVVEALLHPAPAGGQEVGQLFKYIAIVLHLQLEVRRNRVAAAFVHEVRQGFVARRGASLARRLLLIGCHKERALRLHSALDHGRQRLLLTVGVPRGGGDLDVGVGTRVDVDVYHATGIGQASHVVAGGTALVESFHGLVVGDLHGAQLDGITQLLAASGVRADLFHDLLDNFSLLQPGGLPGFGLQSHGHSEPRRELGGPPWLVDLLVFILIVVVFFH